MHVLSALAAGLLAARASAFLIPFDISEAVERAKNDLIHVFTEPVQTVDLDCPGCPFAGVETALWQDDVENQIHLDFDASISSGLTINNQTVLPSGFDRPASITITAKQIRSEDGAETQPLPLDFALERLEPLSDVHNSQNMIIPVRFTIFAIGGKPVKVDTIAIDLVRTEDTLLIGRISNIPFEATPGAETCEAASRWSLCRLKAIISFRLQQMFTAARTHAHSWGRLKGGCGGRRKHDKPEPGRMGLWGQGRPQHSHHAEHAHHHHHRHHHQHGRLRRFGKMLHQTLRFFVIPAMLGVIGGLIASAVGMLVGQAIVYLWLNCYRKAMSAREQPRVEVVVVEDEKDRLMAEGLFEEEALPPYHDVPPEDKDVEAQTQEEK